MIPYYLIANVGTLCGDVWAQHYPRHLVLAQVIKEAPPLYRTVLQRMRARGVRFILDNGAYEEAEFDYHNYKDICHWLQPQVVVLPDVLGVSWQESKSAASTFLRQMEWCCPEGLPTFMYVPQGLDQEDTLAGYEDAIASPPTGHNDVILGLGKSYLHWVPDPKEKNRHNDQHRLQMMKEILQIPGATSWDYHVLGGRKNPCTGWHVYSDNIVGLDAYEPCQCAVANTTYPYMPDVRDPHGSLREPLLAGALQHSVRNFCERYGLDGRAPRAD